MFIASGVNEACVSGSDVCDVHFCREVRVFVPMVFLCRSSFCFLYL